MNNALTRVYAMQQRELNAKERQRQQDIAKRQRLIAAFNASGLLNIFNEFRATPVRADIRRSIYKQRVGELTWQETTPADQLSSMNFVSINGQSSGPRWWCEESRETGTTRYMYSSGRSGDHGTAYDTPNGPWLDMFIEYLAAAADPDEIAQKMHAENDSNIPASTRRQMQPV